MLLMSTGITGLDDNNVVNGQGGGSYRTQKLSTLSPTRLVLFVHRRCHFARRTESAQTTSEIQVLRVTMLC